MVGRGWGKQSGFLTAPAQGPDGGITPAVQGFELVTFQWQTLCPTAKLSPQTHFVGQRAAPVAGCYTVQMLPIPIVSRLSRPEALHCLTIIKTFRYGGLIQHSANFSHSTRSHTQFFDVTKVHKLNLQCLASHFYMLIYPDQQTLNTSCSVIRLHQLLKNIMTMSWLSVNDTQLFVQCRDGWFRSRR